MTLPPIGAPGFSTFDIPIIGGHIAKIGRIVDLWYEPCLPTPELWVKAFFQAAPTALLTPLKPELWDIDIPGHRPRPKTRRQLFFRTVARFSDAIFIVPVPSWRVFRAFELTQLAGWYLLLADVFEQFLINWMSLAYELQGCGPELVAYGQRTVKEGYSRMPESGELILGLWFEEALKNVTATKTAYIPHIAGDYRVGVALVSGPPPPDIPGTLPRSFISGIQILDLKTETILATSETAPDPDNKDQSRASAYFHWDGEGEPEIAVRAFGNHGDFDYTGSTFTISLATGKNLGIDP